LPEHAKSAWLKAVRALPPAWLLPPATSERFEGRNHCLKRLNRYGLYEGFAVVSGRVWKETTPRWQFLCKIYGKATPNKRKLEARKVKDEEGNLVTDRQRDTIIKVKKDCRFEYILSCKAISNRSNEKEYIRTLRYLEYIYLIYLNPFSFKIHETGIIEYQTLIEQARKYRISNVSYLES
jgi:hypothetical protein